MPQETKSVPYVDWQTLFKMGVPIQYHELLKGYVNDRKHPDFFLYNVLANDLRGALALFTGLGGLPVLNAVVKFVEYQIPYELKGSTDKVDAWIQTGPMRPLDKDDDFTQAHHP